MNDQKNKQQQPSHQGNKQDKKQDNRQDDKQQGQQSNKQEQSKHHMRTGTDQSDQPDKKTQIDDNPEETKKKIPNMGEKH